MPRPHFSESPDYPRFKQQFDALQTLQPLPPATPLVDALLFGILRAGYSLNESELPLPLSARLATMKGQDAAGFREGFRTRLVAEQRAIEMLRETTAREQQVDSCFIDSLVAAAQGFISDKFRRADLAWTQAHQHRNDPSIAPEQPAFADVLGRVAERLGYVRTEASQARTRKAS